MAIIEVKVPDIGDFEDVAVIEVLVEVGDAVEEEQSLITVESDKASMEIPSDAAGVVKEVKVKLGDQVNEGSVILTLEAAGAAQETPQAEQKAAPEPDAAAPAAEAAAAAPAGNERIEVHVPDIGDFSDVAVIEVLIEEGDEIKLEQSLITVESDKASMEIPSTVAGTVKELRIKLGDTVNQGDLIAVLEGVAAAAPAAPAAAEKTASAAAPAASDAPAPATAASTAAAEVGAHRPGGSLVGLPYASPSVRKFARELGVPLQEVKGTGDKGRITHEDVKSFTRSVMSGAQRTAGQAAGGSGVGLDLLPWPKVDFSKIGPVERKPLSRIKKISGANLSRNWVMIPHVTNNDEADVTDLEALRKQLNKENERSGLRVTMLAFVIKAAVAALKKFPEFNTSLDGDELVYKQYYNIGFAADTPNGLVVPVLKDADKKGVFEISTEMGELAAKARDGKLGPAAMQGGCFTISSLGGIGGTHFTPIINAPEVAILGLSRSAIKPIWDGEQFVPRLILPMSLSYDHRVIDGAAAARFNAYLGQLLTDFRRALL